MLENQFYPTPRAVIEKMLEPFATDKLSGRKYYDLARRTILEPSAGKGDILDFLTKDAGIKQSKCYACELDSDLQFVLQGKGYKVIESDFLKLQPDYHFNLVIGNPPFASGDEHLLKAWEVLAEGDLVFLLNAETILNPYSQRRKQVAKLIEDHGSYELLGDCFRAAERTTDVNVALVRLKKVKAAGRFHFDFSDRGTEQEYGFDEHSIRNPLARQSAIENTLLQYANLKEAYAEYLKARARLSFYSQGLYEAKYKDIFSLVDAIQGETNEDRYNAFCDESKQVIWQMIIRKLGIERYMTKSVLDNFKQFSSTQGALSLTEENIQQFIFMLLENSGQILEKAVVDVFDIFTAYHKDNRLHVEGWKTNDKYKVNRKVILPGYLSSAWTTCYDMNHYRWDEFADIDRVMCYLTGKKYEDFNELVGEYEYNTPSNEKRYKMESLANAIKRVKVGDSSLHESEFFQFRCYKKGTLHITFKDEKLWQEFNIRATKGKNWLPEKEYDTWRRQKQTQSVAML